MKLAQIKQCLSDSTPVPALTYRVNVIPVCASASRLALVGGADRSNCFFKDPAVRWEDAMTKDPNTGVATFSSEKHRKIRLYRAAADDLDSNGHGTHVMGSLLGSPYDSSDLTSVNFRRASGVSHVPVHVAPKAL